MPGNDRHFSKIASCIIIAFLVLLIGGMLFLNLSFAEKDAVPNIFGYTVYQTHTRNMEPSIPMGTVIFAKETGNIGKGSVVLCRISGTTVLTRVIGLVSENGETLYEVRFDTESHDNVHRVSGENIIAKAVSQSVQAGELLEFALSAKGIVLIMLVSCFCMFVLLKSNGAREEEM